MGLWPLLFQLGLIFGFGDGYSAPDTEILQAAMPGLEQESPQLSFSSTWLSLGPFQIGTREAVWGADPLERFGGFRNLSYDTADEYPSSLAPNAWVQWGSHAFEVSNRKSTACVNLSVVHQDIDWAFQRSIYGWAALQYQTWTRGVLLNASPSAMRVSLYPTGILELWINEEHHFGGDFYGFKRAPIVLNLPPGNSTIQVRLVRDVRASGGETQAPTDASLCVNVLSARVGVVANSLLLPNVVNGAFVSSFASITLSNHEDDWILVDAIQALDADHKQLTPARTRIAPGQSRPLHFAVNDLSPIRSSMHGTIQYSVPGQVGGSIEFQIKPTRRRLHEPHKITFMHPSGSVSYAILRPPSKAVSLGLSEELPILLALHGAGLEADSHQVRHSFDAVPDLLGWLLFPTGMSPWSGDDWHTWGLTDVEAAVQAVRQWIADNEWAGPKATTDRYVVCGHSNGGQGAWHLALHQPDRLLAAAAASGYSSIENYVPYVMWKNADPLQMAILNMARSSFKHELFLLNLANKPVLIQHGQDDDNVPAYHGRLMKSLAAEYGLMATYVEFPSKGHWWDEAMVTEPMLEFYNETLSLQENGPTLPEEFTCVIGNSDDFGSCFGVAVDQLASSDRLARLKVSISQLMNATFWHIRTENIHRFHLDFSVGVIAPDAIHIDDEPTTFETGGTKGEDSFRCRTNGRWMREADDSWRTLGERIGRQRGAMDSILRTQGPFQIVYASDEALSIALQISRNLLQYYGAASDIRPMAEYQQALGMAGNTITVALGAGLPNSQLAGFPIQVRDGTLELRSRLALQKYTVESGTGGAWLRPLPHERLELVVWGFDEAGLRQAARMVPTLTGGGQPDFVLFRKEATWEGVGGAFALGFFDHSWNISAVSYLR